MFLHAVNKLRKAISMTKAPCNDFYSFVCSRFPRVVHATKKPGHITSPLNQDNLISLNTEEKMIQTLAGNGCEYICGSNAF